jgi:hypothetical protein
MSQSENLNNNILNGGVRLPSKADCDSSAIGGVLFGGNMKEIKLTQGKVALIDDEDFDIVNLFKWRIYKGRNTSYAYTIVRFGKTEVSLFMHRLIMNAPHKSQIDHKDNNGLNNKKVNLRFSNYYLNQMNRPKRHKKTSSKYKGVVWYKRTKRWRAHIQVYGVPYSLGYFSSEKAAAQAYNFVAKEKCGEHAKLNDV